MAKGVGDCPKGGPHRLIVVFSDLFKPGKKISYKCTKCGMRTTY